MIEGSVGTIKTVYNLAFFQVSLGIFDIKILLKFVCCVDETWFGSGKMFVNELLHFCFRLA